MREGNLILDRNKKRVDMTQMPPMQTYTKGHNSEVPHAIFPAIKLDHEFIPKHNYRKFGEDWMETVSIGWKLFQLESGNNQNGQI